MKKRIETKTLVIWAFFCALAYALVFVSRLAPSIVLFLKYDPKDVIIVIGGFIYGPIASLAISVVVSFIEMITVSTTGWIGLIMNILSSCVFCCTASLIYKKKHTQKGAIIGLIVACLLTTSVMLLWNYLITPIHMGYPRAAVADLLVPAFLPFNLVKTVANSAFVLMIYKPLVNALRKAKLIQLSSGPKEAKKSKGFILYSIAVLAILSCILIVLALNGII